MNYATDFKSVRGAVSAGEWQARVDLAACYRLMDCYGMTDLIYNHITARIPGTDHLLINLYGLLYREITASSLVKIDVEGNILQKPDTDYSINKSGYVIHGAIHKARPDVSCIIHTHTRARRTCLYPLYLVYALHHDEPDPATATPVLDDRRDTHRRRRPGARPGGGASRRRGSGRGFPRRVERRQAHCRSQA